MRPLTVKLVTLILYVLMTSVDLNYSSEYRAAVPRRMCKPGVKNCKNWWDCCSESKLDRPQSKNYGTTYDICKSTYATDDHGRIISPIRMPPNSVGCLLKINIPPGFILTIAFEEFVFRDCLSHFVFLDLIPYDVRLKTVDYVLCHEDTVLSTNYVFGSGEVVMYYLPSSPPKKKGFSARYSVTSNNSTNPSSPETSSANSSTPATGTLPPCKCGVPNRANRIVGGVETEVFEYPWQVAVIYTKHRPRPWCGGTILNNYWVMTAAHCTIGIPTSKFLVDYWEHDVTTSGHKSTSVSRIVEHPEYENHTFRYDFSLLQVKIPFSFPSDNTVAPVCLPADPNELYLGVHAIITGWGHLSSGGPKPHKLQEAEVHVISNSDCKKKYFGMHDITEDMICASVPGGGIDSCNGDSGGPLVAPRNGTSNTYDLIGVVSFGKGCGSPYFPGVYARITSQISWIQLNIKHPKVVTCS